ncbi:Aste57867_21595 [Aphanomyces stellatus]|uniref:Aste57867_21595 protein n=1 Tax=Aphanomyces stellatus TaxID=120398 RepID=A0A485LHY9_9STRA|nr:hypothetical protein As57867_021526 [Aphanomyces stellatus]VFT98265.1 Aste57867_21595 [Aphanomyces stellatus]
MLMLQLNTPTAVFVLFCLINLLNYIDRGIIPGSPLQFQGFISSVQHGSNGTASGGGGGESTWLGLLVSAFIAGYSVFSIAFGYWAIYYRPFVLIAAGLAVWIVAMLLCGLSDAAKNLNVLLVGRVLSGVGESSFQAIAPSFIDDHAPPAKRTLWLGIFYCGITVGTAAGYLYSTLFASSALRWPWAFYTEGILMAPLVVACVCCIPAKYNQPGGQQLLARKRKSIAEASFTRPSSDISLSKSYDDGCILQSTLSIVEQSHASAVLSADDDAHHPSKAALIPRVALHVEIWEILKSPLFILVSLGSAAYVFSISGLAAFGPSLLIGMGLFEEQSAAMVFGGIVVVAGTIGTLLGGLFLDRNCKCDSDNEDFRVYMATRQLCLMLTIGTVCLIVSWLLLDQGRFLAISMLSIALTFLFGCVPASVVAIILSVEKRRRGLALGINTLLSHVLGDVPSPIIIGLLKDHAAPNCNTLDNNKLNPRCAGDRQGLKLTLLLPYLWLIWAILLSTVAVCLARRTYMRRLTAEGRAPSSPAETPALQTC